MLKLGLIFLCFLIASSVSEVTFAGLWTDDVSGGGFGGNFSICVDGTTGNGLYSEFGLAIGTISDNGTVWSGNFYEGGVGDCTWGPFVLTLKDNGTIFEGSYGCERPKLTKKWTSTKLSSDVQTDYACAKVISLTSKDSLDGKWFKASNGKSSSLDFCTESDDDGDYKASYVNPTYTPEGYDQGVWISNRKIAYGVSYRANFDGALPATSLWFINPSGQLANIWWIGLTGDLNINEIRDTNIHNYDLWEFSHGTDSNQCIRYKSLATQKFDYYPYEDELFYFEPYYREVETTMYNSSAANNSSNASSDASMVTLSVLVILISLLFC